MRESIIKTFNHDISLPDENGQIWHRMTDPETGKVYRYCPETSEYKELLEDDWTFSSIKKLIP